MATQRGISSALFLEIAATVIGPWLLLHFFIILPEERVRLQNNPFIYLVYLPAIVTLILFPLIGLDNGSLRVIAISCFSKTDRTAGVAGVAIFNYFHAVSLRTRQQMKIVLISCLAALIPFLLVYLLPQIVWKQNIIPPGFSILFIGIIPIGMGYAVITQKLLDIDILIRRGLIYGLVTIGWRVF
jgi:hypothetical protein